MGNHMRVENLNKKYKNGNGIEDISFSLEKSEVLGVIGKSGSGKSTILKTIIGLNKKDSGNIEILGSQSEKELTNKRKYIGSSVNSPNFYMSMTAFENLKYLSIARGIANQDEDILDILNLVDLTGVLKIKYLEYSLGMKQKLAIGAALLGNPSILILDEITTGLDPINVAKFRDLIKKLTYEKGTSVIITSHILEEVSLIATKYLFIHKGCVKEYITDKELKEKFRTHIELQTSDCYKTVVILEEVLKIKDYIVLENKIIQIYDRIDEIDVISKTLILQDLSIYKINLKSQNLGEYFVGLIGEMEKDV
ncbi:MAG: ABC transporter ATP-binding protein [Sarcina sp.]